MSNLRRSYATAKNAPQAMVVHCSDHRFQPAFAEFIRDELLLPPGHYVPLVFGGGAGTLARPQLVHEYGFVSSRLNLHKGHSPQLERLVLITHQDCKYYEFIRHVIGDRVDHLPHHDLATLHPAIDEPATPPEFVSLVKSLGLRVEPFYARFLDGDQTIITIEPIIV